MCSDPTRDWHPRTATCWATASREWGMRRLAKLYEDEKPSDEALHPLDGVAVYVTQEPPEGDEDPFA